MDLLKHKVSNNTHTQSYYLCYRYKQYVEYNPVPNMANNQQCSLNFTTAACYSPKDVKQRTLVKSIALNLVVDCALPISIVERPGWDRFIKSVDPKYGAVDRYVCIMYIP